MAHRVNHLVKLDVVGVTEDALVFQVRPKWLYDTISPDEPSHVCGRVSLDKDVVDAKAFAHELDACVAETCVLWSRECLPNILPVNPFPLTKGQE